jgi:hypothetical protein
MDMASGSGTFYETRPVLYGGQHARQLLYGATNVRQDV